MSYTHRLARWLLRRGWAPHTAALVEHYLNMLWEQAFAVIPITCQLVVTIAIFFQRQASNAGELAWGLTCAILGLTLFVDALRISVMPLGEMLGEELPKRLPMWAVLAVAFVLGVLCTFAEPAIASLRPLARLVSKSRTPYLHLMLNELQELLILAIGLGVGVAAVLGTLRFVKGWKLKPLIAGTILPTVALAVYMHWGQDGDLSPLIGLAWDCGAVTTGPVTVPILLALGIGVMKTSKERAAAKAALAVAVKTTQQPALDGFGIVTLASILPVMMVQILAIASSFIFSKEDIINSAPVSELESVTDVSPVREIIFAFRAILPLNAVLILLVLLILRAPLPKLTVFVPSDSLREEAIADGEGPVNTPKDQLSMFPSRAAKTPVSPSDSDGATAPTTPSIESEPAPAPASAPRMGCLHRTAPHGVWALVWGVIIAQVGAILFNVGLTYGFTSIGDQFGQLLPASFIGTGEPGSPFYSFAGGVALTICSVFLLGFLATRAEPALNVLGKTVEKLSRGTFSRNLLIYSVCIGVAAGMCAGSTKILFEVSVIYFILAKYGVACLLTVFSDDDFTAIAWDSAGVTTGPVTVPFVLSTGIGFNKAANSPEGFGILTCASVAPIITVLLADQMRKLYHKAVDEVHHYQSRRASQTHHSGSHGDSRGSNHEHGDSSHSHPHHNSQQSGSSGESQHEASRGSRLSASVAPEPVSVHTTTTHDAASAAPQVA